MDYYVIRLVSDKPLDCCGTRYCTAEKDVDFILSLWPKSIVEKHNDQSHQLALRELFS